MKCRDLNVEYLCRECLLYEDGRILRHRRRTRYIKELSNIKDYLIYNKNFMSIFLIAAIENYYSEYLPILDMIKILK
jgi:hypothetical protein